MSLLSPPDRTHETASATQSCSSLLQREMPGLDALRGIAILSVVAYHGLHWWLPVALSTSNSVKIVSAVTTPGWLGVNLFFVLSGFLITGILIDTRSHPQYWKNFYTRRILRIFPLYLVILSILPLYATRDWRYLLLCLFYLANFAKPRTGYGNGALWSLAVEEQFYLIWPFLVRGLRLRTLATVCLASIAVSPLLRYLSVCGCFPHGDPYTATWLVTDNLSTGALVAIFLRSRAATQARVFALTLIAGLSGALLLALGIHCHIMSRATAAGAAFQSESFLLLFTALLLLALQYGNHPVVFRLTRPLRFYGFISYGLYLIHLIGFKIFDSLYTDSIPITTVLTLHAVLFRFIVVLACETFLCYLSRRYFEAYFLGLKDRLAPNTTPPK